MNIPALAYGPNIWSTLRITNRSAAPRTIQLEVYRENGDRVPMQSSWEIGARATREIRIDPQTGDDESCWARIIDPSEDAAIEVEGSVEALNGNAIRSYSRKAKTPSANDLWVTRAMDVEGKEIYFLNVYDRPTILQFCASNDRWQRNCPAKGAGARFRVNPNQAVAVQVKKLRRQYFITQSTVAGKAILLLFDDGPGTKHVFSSDSSIDFAEPAR